jgi:hypothetical protein
MKSVFFVLFILFSFFNRGLNAIETDFIQQPIGNTQHVTGKLKMSSCWVFIMEDDSAWVVKNPPLEGQTWSEWWHKQKHKQMFPKYYFNLLDWAKTPIVQIYEYTWDLETATTLFKGNETEAKNVLDYPFLIQDLQTGETVFARRLSGVDLVESLLHFAEANYKEGYDTGYNVGWSVGYNWGYQAGKNTCRH